MALSLFWNKRKYISFYLCFACVSCMHTSLWAIPSPAFATECCYCVCACVCVYINLLVLDKINYMSKKFFLHLPYVHLCIIALFLELQDGWFLNEILIGEPVPLQKSTSEILPMYHKSWSGQKAKIEDATIKW